MKKYLILLVLILLTGCGSVEESYNLSTDNLVEAHNEIRVKNNISILKEDDQLNTNAQKWAVWMANHNNLKHSKLDFNGFRYIGENIAEGQRDVNEVMNGWMHSPGHKRNILNKGFTKIGVGKAINKNGVIYWCVQFGGTIIMWLI